MWDVACGAQHYYTEKEARDVLKVLLGAIAFSHDKKIVHRDLKVSGAVELWSEIPSDLMMS
jgi:serine/threonine protein kinase